MYSWKRKYAVLFDNVYWVDVEDPELLQPFGDSKGCWLE